MCYSERCCLIISLDFGCIIGGVISLMLSTISACLSTIALCIAENEPEKGSSFVLKLTHLEFNSPSVKIVLTLTTIVEVLWMFFSVTLILGIKKNKSSLVLSYFSFGIMMTIIWSLSGLLVLLQKHWILTLIILIAVAIHTYFLVVVHTAYEYMQRGNPLTESPQYHSDETLLIE